MFCQNEQIVHINPLTLWHSHRGQARYDLSHKKILSLHPLRNNYIQNLLSLIFFIFTKSPVICMLDMLDDRVNSKVFTWILIISVCRSFENILYLKQHIYYRITWNVPDFIIFLFRNSQLPLLILNMIWDILRKTSKSYNAKFTNCCIWVIKCH